jgi:hypothetical protein
LRNEHSREGCSLRSPPYKTGRDGQPKRRANSKVETRNMKKKKTGNMTIPKVHSPLITESKDTKMVEMSKVKKSCFKNDQ